MEDLDGRRRVVIEGVEPEIDAGRYPIKRIVGETVQVQADIILDGHDLLAGVLLYKFADDAGWREVPLAPLVNDRWFASFRVSQLGQYLYTLEAWVDHFGSWRYGMKKKLDAGVATPVDFQVGANLVAAAAERAGDHERARMSEWAGMLRAGVPDAAFDPELEALMRKHVDRSSATRYERELSVTVDRQRAGFSAWYEMFPRSTSPEPGRHGTLRDCAARLDYAASMGFDVVYLPPIHPIGKVNRKGKNNAPTAGPEDVGSCWAIGSVEGGHKTVNPKLGTIDDVRALVARAAELGMEIALDIAFQCAPDHPYVREHPSWFRMRPDGTVQYAENPPKKYQDIYPLDFETPDWRDLWEELKSVVLYWVSHGIRIFRVDNPHTKPLPFWEWLIAEVKREHPDVIFLSEAFTRPKVMYNLAKAGFSQSYTYFSWRNTRHDLERYFSELRSYPTREFFRPNAWPNTPDILPEYLQMGGRPAAMIRLVLAATLASNYGIYGPLFELGVNTAREPGSEEYLHSEKYEVRHWNLESEWSLRDFIALVNQIRRENPALQSDRRLIFHPTDNENVICYSKTTEDLSNVVVIAVNLDFRHRHSAWLELDLRSLGLEESRPYQVHDLLGDGRFLWQGSRNYVELDPNGLPVHVMRIRRKTRTEADFDYYM